MNAIREHAGSKYLRLIHAADSLESVYVDVYEVLIAFEVVCPARQHALKKLLCSGTRGKASEIEDLTDALASISRAIEIASRRVRSKKKPSQRSSKRVEA